MITTRAMTEQDQPALQAAIKRDTFHPGEWSVDDFIFEPDSNYEKKRLPKICTVIEDQNGPITFVRFTKTLRVCCTWVDAEDTRRNARAIIFGVLEAVQTARANGFAEIVIQTDHPKLAAFLEKACGMKNSKGEFLISV